MKFTDKIGGNAHLRIHQLSTKAQGCSRQLRILFRIVKVSVIEVTGLF
jgi:hypothetical protein